MGALFDFIDSIGAAIKARLRIKAQRDLEAGAKIVAQAEAEAREMEAAARGTTDKNWPPPIPKPEGGSNG